jgi:hypothetical protein
MTRSGMVNRGTNWSRRQVLRAAAASGIAAALPRQAGAAAVDAGRLADRMARAWDVTWSRFFLPRTSLLYDYLSSYEPGRELAHLPTSAEIARGFPNECGYGTGMEDCMISAGTMLMAIVDRHAVTGEAFLRDRALDLVRGIRLCATVHGVPGFLARGVCHEDLKSIYPNSSRDQYTHAAHGLWVLARSPLCDAPTRIATGEILSAIADRMTRNVTPENDYDSLRADGSRDTRGISRMWNVKGHEAARLPMLYAAAWDATGRREYLDLCRRYVEPAVEQSLVLEDRQPTYAWLQMQGSLELLESVEQDSGLKRKMRGIMTGLASRCAARAVSADRASAHLDLTAAGPNWRLSGGLGGEYRKAWTCIRESGEAALAQLMAGKAAFPESHADLLARAIARLDYGRVSSCGIFHLQAAYWKARRYGLFNEEKVG